MLRRRELHAEMGVAILMEVETGDIKAIVNMMRTENDQYIEAVNSAISYRCEPGSVFKTASILVALDDGVLGKNPQDTSYIIHTGGGVMPMYGREMMWSSSLRVRPSFSIGPIISSAEMYCELTFP